MEELNSNEQNHITVTGNNSSFLEYQNYKDNQNPNEFQNYDNQTSEKQNKRKTKGLNKMLSTMLIAVFSVGTIASIPSPTNDTVANIIGYCVSDTMIEYEIEIENRENKDISINLFNDFTNRQTVIKSSDFEFDENEFYYEREYDETQIIYFINDNTYLITSFFQDLVPNMEYTLEIRDENEQLSTKKIRTIKTDMKIDLLEWYTTENMVACYFRIENFDTNEKIDVNLEADNFNITKRYDASSIIDEEYFFAEFDSLQENKDYMLRVVYKGTIVCSLILQTTALEQYDESMQS